MAKRFYPSTSGMGSMLDDVLQMAQIASDWQYREKAIKLKAQIDQMAAGDPDLPTLQKEYSALLANISEADLKPK